MCLKASRKGTVSFCDRRSNRFTITKAPARFRLHPAVTIINDLAKTYEMVLSTHLPEVEFSCELEIAIR